MNLFDVDGWRARAACRGMDPNLWVPNTRGEGRPMYEPARTVCKDCPVKQACLDYALTHHEEHGMWGGTTPADRKEMGYMTTRKPCKTCGTLYLKTQGGQRYCSDDCRDRRRRRPT